MGHASKIEWTDATWSPIRARVKADAVAIAQAKGYTSLVPIAAKMAGHVGPHCEHVSAGCNNCYAETNNHRCLPSNGTGLPFDRRSRDLIDPIVDEDILAWPLHWKQPRRVFVENQSDLFGEWISDEMIDRVFAVMALCPGHTFQIPTKRPWEMRKWFARDNVPDLLDVDIHAMGIRSRPEFEWPLPNVWLGVSVEDQATADERIPLLLQTPAAVRFVSYEPALGPVEFEPHLCVCARCYTPDLAKRCGAGLHWVIVGGESGPGARPMHPGWVRSARDQCQASGVPFFFKQWGEWGMTAEHGFGGRERLARHVFSNGHGTGVEMIRVGKKAAGALLDGREWREFPGIQRAVAEVSA